MAVILQGISKKLSSNFTLKNINLAIEEGEYVSLVGPSGAGKTTLLKIMASIVQPDEGRISFAREPSRKNPVIMVFQNFALFPHMTVMENIGYGLKLRKVSKEKIDKRVDSILDWFGIADKALEYPARLSAGQRQRAAIARAIIIEPMLLLLDEPFANLDKNLKGETARFIQRTQQKFGLTTVMVTHDQDEAFAVSNRIGVLINGELRQVAAPAVLKNSPADKQTAEFLEAPLS